MQTHAPFNTPAGAPTLAELLLAHTEAHISEVEHMYADGLGPSAADTARTAGLTKPYVEQVCPRYFSHP